jgi:hypothetical protein
MSHSMTLPFIPIISWGKAFVAHLLVYFQDSLFLLSPPNMRTPPTCNTAVVKDGVKKNPLIQNTFGCPSCDKGHEQHGQGR